MDGRRNVFFSFCVSCVILMIKLMYEFIRNSTIMTGPKNEANIEKLI